MTPLVAIVGAGPGAADLLTVRGARRLAQADVVFYDGLVPIALVAEHAPQATLVCVSRRPGANRVAPAEAARRVAEAARAGQRVVRLRAGDPFVLARGAEELLGLAAAGVPFEIVPGLTAATAAATLAGIPLTHRGTASAFVVVSGHAPEAYAPVLSGIEPDLATIVVLMGLAERTAIAALLQVHGWRPETPAALIISSSQPAEHVVRTSLGALAVDVPDLSADDPGVIIIGNVVDVGESIARSLVSSQHDSSEAVAWQR